MINTKMIPVVILDCDFRSQSGIIQTFGRKKIPIVALSSKKCPAFHSRYVTKKIISPSLDDGEKTFIDFLLDLPEKGVLIYSNDPCAVAISKHQEKLKDAGFLLNIPDPVSLKKIFDKWECYKLATSLDIPMAKTRPVACINDVYDAWDEFAKPVILKGTTLAGGMYHKLSNKKEVPGCWEKISRTVNHQAYASRQSGIILQEYQQYNITDNWSCETVYDQNSNPAGFFTIQRIRCSLNDDGTYSSRLFAGEHITNTDLVEKTRKILSRMQWKGFAHVEYFYVPEKKAFMLTEVNPRLPGYSYYPCAAGFDMAYYYYADLVDISYPPPSNFPQSIYFETFHDPGDLNMGLVRIFQGYLAPLPFLSSYLNLLVPGKTKIIDPIRLDDPVFSFYTQLEIIRDFTLRCYNYTKRKLPKLMNNRLKLRIPYRVGKWLKKKQHSLLYFENKHICSEKNRNSEYVPIFVFGLPRSGSTLVYQSLVTSIECCYFSNLAATMPLIPLTISRLTKIVGGQSSPPVFQSNYGNTSSWNEPSVGVSIWGRWFPPDQTFLEENNLDKKTMNELKNTVFGMQNTFSAPFIGKWQGFNSVFSLLNEAFPKCFFVRATRNYNNVAQSILKARKDSGNEKNWFSSKTSAYNKIVKSTDDPVHQVCLQILYLEKDIDEFFDNIPQSRRVTIDYSDFCRDPGKILTYVFGRYNKISNNPLNTNLKKIPQKFTELNKQSPDQDKITKIISELSEIV
ncbi:MAG: sulfotransferase [Thermodesulfobacteriota bacterium]|nr:sulfotransferase [Thermodesulfobacteriota bacterium]